MLGIVHASGVEVDLDRENMKDEHRVLVTDDDGMGNIEQITRLISLGYRGNVALEVFSARVQGMEKKDFLLAAARCIDFLLDGCHHAGCEQMQ